MWCISLGGGSFGYSWVGWVEWVGLGGKVVDTAKKKIRSSFWPKKGDVNGKGLFFF